MAKNIKKHLAYVEKAKDATQALLAKGSGRKLNLGNLREQLPRLARAKVIDQVRKSYDPNTLQTGSCIWILETENDSNVNLFNHEETSASEEPTIDGDEPLVSPNEITMGSKSFLNEIN